MNFNEWYKKNDKEADREDVPPPFMVKLGWEACKDEILKIIFLNMQQNGKKTIDVNKLIEEIEKL